MKNEIADRLEKYANEIRDSYDPKDNLRDVIADAPSKNKFVNK